MKTVSKWFRLYLPFAKSEIQAVMNYRISFFLFILAGIMYIFITYYLWKAIFHSSPNATLAGFSLQDMIIYIFISEITSRLTFSNIDAMIGTEVVEGSIAINLIRPINYQIRLFFSALGRSIYQIITSALPIWIGLVAIRFFIVGQMPPNLQTLLLYVVSTFLSFLIMFLFNFAFGMISFYTSYIWGLRMSKMAVLRFFSGSLIPIAFFPIWLQDILKFLPFNSMNYTPVMIYLNKYSGMDAFHAISTQILWIVVFFALTHWVWNKAVNRLTILGG